MNGEDTARLEHKKKFSQVYDNSNYSSPLQSIVMRKSHKLVEKAYNSKFHFSKVIEIGAGKGEHLPFVRHTFDEYILNDLDSKTLKIAKNKLHKVYAGKVSHQTQIDNALEYPDSTFDRLIATHVLEHIYEPHLALKDWYRVLKHGGVLSILMPTDPGLLWRLGRHLGPRKNAMAQGIAYDYVMAREHVNSCNNLVAILRHYLPNRLESWWPLPIASVDLNLFFAFHTTINKQEIT